MQIKCTDAEGVALTLGKVYQVVKFGDKRFTIVNDLGIAQQYYIYRFTNAKETKTMSTKSPVSYHVLPNSIVINHKGQNWSLNKADARYAPVLKAIKENRLDDVPTLLDVAKVYGVAGLKVKDNNLWLDGEALHGVLADRILGLQGEGLPFEPLVKFARKLKKNPSMNSREQLYKFLEHNGHPITTEGNFIAYRGVREDFKDVHSGTFDNSVGSVCSMSRSEVDDNPNNTCSRGLHVACFDYAKSFGQRLVEVEVDPQDVVCVPTDYNGTKMRTCRFKVVSLCEGLNESQLVESDFEGTQLDEEEFTSHADESDELLDEEIEIEDEESDDTNDWEQLILNPSDVVESAEYQKDTETLDVYLKDGSCYRYSNVPSKVTYEWEEARSTGSYFVCFISHSYPFTKIA